ncbi:MAG: N-acetylmuramoyl-L-alanine amidase, partial [Mycobacteriales bacterium]
GAGPASTVRQRAFAAASNAYGVPASVLLGVSYMESRWDDHGAAPSTSGGYGPMHLTDISVEAAGQAKGDGSFRSSDGPDSLHTASIAAALTKLDPSRLKSDDTANICGGAAVLASYQRGLGRPTGASSATAAWYDSVKSYSGAATPADAVVFADRVFATIRTGSVRTTSDGQRLQLTSEPALAMPKPDQATLAASAQADSHIDCPSTISCEWIPAPYEQYGTTPGEYGNHDLANRPTDLDIDYIVIHNTEATYATTLQLVQDPTYVSWNYSIRSSDGHVAQHLDAKDVGFHAGNWYINMHAIGIEHEGFAAQGATWYTEAMYASSAKLVRYLADKYSVKLDRAHLIGHDQVPGTIPANVPGMHWDPGPYWDWEHYMSLVGAPMHATRRGNTTVVMVKPGFADNQQPVTGCSGSGACTTQGTNFVYLHTAPSASSPLVKDLGLHADGSPSTTLVSDHGARLAAGQQVAVAKRSGDWVGVWYLGDIGWLYSPPSNPDVVATGGRTVSAKPGALTVPVYGRAYPEAAAYAGTGVPYQTVTPLQYTIKAGQKYVLADDTIDTNYYYAKTFDNSLPGDHTVITGNDRYYEIWFGHRIFYVRAADVVVAN